jgi:hypothetical protein
MVDTIARRRHYNREYDRTHRTRTPERRAQEAAAYQRRLIREGPLDMPVLDELHARAVGQVLSALLADETWGHVAPGTVSLEAIRAEGAAHTARVMARDQRTGRNWRRRHREILAGKS